MQIKARIYGMKNKLQYEMIMASNNNMHNPSLNRVTHVIIVGYHYLLPLLHTATCFSCHIS